MSLDKAIEAMQEVTVVVKLLPEESIIGNYCTIERGSLRKLLEAALPHLQSSAVALKYFALKLEDAQARINKAREWIEENSWEYSIYSAPVVREIHGGIDVNELLAILAGETE